MFSDVDAMVEAALVTGKRATESNRSEADRLRAELSQADRELAKVSALLVDPDVMTEPMAKKSILRKAADLESRRESLLGSLDKVLDKANDDGDRLAEIVRQKLLEAKERWEAVASPAQLNQMIGELVEPSIVTADGRLLAVPTKNPAHAVNVHGVVAGACSVPDLATGRATVDLSGIVMQGAFWSRFASAT